MPIISFNISNNLKKFLRQMVGSKEYKNNSYVMRDALVRLMHEKESSAVGSEPLSATSLEDLLPKISSSILITINKFNTKLERKLNRLETRFHDGILHKSVYCHRDKKSIMYVVESVMSKTQEFITELNSIEELLAFRYIINEPE